MGVVCCQPQTLEGKDQNAKFLNKSSGRSSKSTRHSTKTFESVKRSDWIDLQWKEREDKELFTKGKIVLKWRI